jgi:lactoylglutathione lyase
MVPAMPLAIVILAVEDLARSVAFYTTAFACTEAVSSPSYVELEIGGSVRLGLYEQAGFGRNIGRLPASLAPGDISRTELYFRVDAMAAASAKLEAAGARVLSDAQQRPWGEIAAYYADPDGNVIAIAVPA